MTHNDEMVLQRIAHMTALVRLRATIEHTEDDGDEQAVEDRQTQYIDECRVERRYIGGTDTLVHEHRQHIHYESSAMCIDAVHIERRDGTQKRQEQEGDTTDT